MMTVLLLLLPAAAAALLTFALAPLAAPLAFRLGAIDMPGDRKVHGAGIPRLGGLAVIAASGIVWSIWLWLGHGRGVPPELAMGVAVGVLPILMVSFVDDVRSVGAPVKLLCHLLGATIAVAFGVCLAPQVHLIGQPLYLGWLAYPLSVVWIVGVTNAINIIDGLDGLAAGLSLIAAASLAAVFALVGQPAMMSAALVLAGSLIGFLPYNLYPARLFLGDIGATTVGFCLAAFALKGGSTLSSGFAVLIPVFMIGLPIADTLIAMARRLLGRIEHHQGGVLVADRNHIHHRLLALGIQHSTAVFILYAAGLAFAAAALVSMFMTTRHAALFVVALLAAGFVGMRRLGYEEFAFIRRGKMLRAYEAPVLNRSLFVVFADMAMVILAAYVAVGLKTETWNIVAMRPMLFDVAVTAAPLTVAVFWAKGMYRGSWRVAGVHDFARATSAVAIVTIIGMFAHAMWLPDLHWTLFFVYGLVSLALVIGSRASYLILRSTHRRATVFGAPVLIYGAGRCGTASAREMFESRTSPVRPIGFIDDDPTKVGCIIQGLPVLGTGSDLQRVVRDLGARALIIAISDLSDDRVSTLGATCRRLGIDFYRMRYHMERLVESEAGAAAFDGPAQTAAVRADALAPAASQST